VSQKKDGGAGNLPRRLFLFEYDKFFNLSYTLYGDLKMNIRILQITAFTALMLTFLVFVACGGEEPTATPRPANNNPPAQGQTDTLDDSLVAPAPVDNGDEEPPAQDPLDDSAVPPGGGASALPQVQDGVVVLTNTAWVLSSDANQTYLFCADGTWNVEGGATPQSGTYQVQGTNLVLNDANNQATTYQMNWNQQDASLGLAGGAAPIQLEYDGAADCG
jgi:hypothetical protein